MFVLKVRVYLRNVRFCQSYISHSPCKGEMQFPSETEMKLLGINVVHLNAKCLQNLRNYIKLNAYEMSYACFYVTWRGFYVSVRVCLCVRLGVYVFA